MGLIITPMLRILFAFVLPICRNVRRYKNFVLALFHPITSFRPSPFNQPG